MSAAPACLSTPAAPARPGPTPEAHLPKAHLPKAHLPTSPASGLSRRCAYCGRPLPAGVTARRQYCCERCRRQAQDRQRKLDRLEAATGRTPVTVAIGDPWERGGLWDLDWLWALSLLDADPCVGQPDPHRDPA